MVTLTTEVRNSEVQPSEVKNPQYFSREELYRIVEDPLPRLTDDYEGKIFMRGSCGGKPCKGYYE